MRRLIAVIVTLAISALAAAEDDPKAPSEGVRVLIVGPDGKPVAGAQVRARLADWSGPVDGWSATSVEDGTATLKGIERNRRYRLEVEGPYDREDLAEMTIDAWEPTDGATLRLAKGRSISGTATDSRGKQRAAWVHYRVPGGRREGASTTETGSFQFRGLPAENVELLATSREVGEKSRGDVPRGAKWTLVPPEQSSVRLLVVDAPKGEERLSLRVRVLGPKGETPSRVTITFGHWGTEVSYPGVDGEATMDVSPPAGFVKVFRALDGHGKQLPWAPERIEMDPSKTPDITVHLKPGVEVSGRVVDEAGSPQSGASVIARGPEDFTGGVLSEAQTDAEGRFVLLGLSEADMSVHVAETITSPATPPLRTRGGARDVVLTVRKSSASRVRVVDADGQPVESAKVTVMRHESAKRASSVVLTDTRSDGTVDVPALDPTLWLTLHVDPPSRLESASRLTIEHWKPASGDVVLPRGFTARLRVVDQDGKPVQASVQRILPTSRPGHLGGWSNEPAPDEEGRLLVKFLPLGSTRFRAMPKGRSGIFPESSKVILVDENRRDADLQIHTKGVSMSIAAEGARAGITWAGVFADIGLDSLPATELEFDTDGKAVLESVAPGKYVVLVGSRAGFEGPVGRADVADFRGGEVRVPLQAAAKIRVRVEGPVGMEKIMGLVQFGGTSVAELSFVESGVGEAGGLPPGRYEVSLFASTEGKALEGFLRVETGVETTVVMKERGE